MTTQEKGQNLHRYWSSNCQSYPLKSNCTTGKQRRVTRWEHEGILDRVERRLACDPGKMRTRSVEHPFGTLKHWMGATHFQMITLEHVSTEMSLHVLAYNMKRVMNILGVEVLIEAITALIWLHICRLWPPYVALGAFQRLHAIHQQKSGTYRKLFWVAGPYSYQLCVFTHPGQQPDIFVKTQDVRFLHSGHFYAYEKLPLYTQCSR